MSVLRQSIQTILDSLNAGKLGAVTDEGCAYHTNDRCKFCAIGCLLTEQEHNYLDTHHMNADTAIDTVFDKLPELNGRLGMTLQQAEAMQNWHDKWVRGGIGLDEYRAVLEGLLNGSVTKILWSPSCTAPEEIEFNLQGEAHV